MAKKSFTAAALASMLAIATPYTASKEGLKLTAYRDIGGVWTICRGETAGVYEGQTETEQECDTMLALKLQAVGIGVWWVVWTPMSSARWAGLTDFTYNLGMGTFLQSTLLKKLNNDDPQACQEIMRYSRVKKLDCTIKANGCYGIIKRREGETKLCNS